MVAADEGAGQRQKGRGGHAIAGIGIEAAQIEAELPPGDADQDGDQQGDHEQASQPEAGAIERSKRRRGHRKRSDEHTSEIQSLMRITYAGFCLTKYTSTRVHKIVRNNKRQYDVTPRTS